MIFYATKETMTRYKLKTPEQFQSEIGPFVRMAAEKERGNRIYEWGCKLFYFDRRKCLQVMHFETKLVIFLVDLKQKDLEFTANIVANYLMDIYAEDSEMVAALNRFFASSPVAIFDKISDRSIIASMNSIQTNWAHDGYAFYSYIQDGILHTRKINREVNEYPVTRKVDGKTEWIVPYALFAQTIKREFAEKTEHPRSDSKEKKNS